MATLNTDPKVSLFGMTPDEVKQHELQGQKDENYKLAMMDPLQASRYQMAQAGTNISNAAMPLLEQAGFSVPKSPQLQEAQTMQSVIKQVQAEGIQPNTNPIEFYQKVAGRLTDAGLTRQGMDLSLKATMLDYDKRKQDAEIKFKNAETWKAYHEKESAVQILNREYKDASDRGDLQAARNLHDAIKKATAEDVKIVKEGDPNNPANILEKIVTNDGKVIYEGKSFKPTPLVDMSENKDKAALGAFATNWSAQKKDMDDNWKTESAMIQPIRTLETIIASGKISNGAYAEQITKAKNILVQMGIIKADDQLTQEQVFDKYAKQLILPQLQALKGSLSDREGIFIENSNLNRAMTIPAIKELLGDLKSRVAEGQRKQQAYSSGIDKYGEENALKFNPLTGEWRAPGNKSSVITSTKDLPKINTPKPSPELYNPAPEEIATFKQANPNVPESVVVQAIRNVRARQGK